MHASGVCFGVAITNEYIVSLGLVYAFFRLLLIILLYSLKRHGEMRFATDSGILIIVFISIILQNH